MNDNQNKLLLRTHAISALQKVDQCCPNDHYLKNILLRLQNPTVQMVNLPNHYSRLLLNLLSVAEAINRQTDEINSDLKLSSNILTDVIDNSTRILESLKKDFVTYDEILFVTRGSFADYSIIDDIRKLNQMILDQINEEKSKIPIDESVAYKK